MKKTKTSAKKPAPKAKAKPASKKPAAKKPAPKKAAAKVVPKAKAAPKAAKTATKAVAKPAAKAAPAKTTVPAKAGKVAAGPTPAAAQKPSKPPIKTAPAKETPAAKVKPAKGAKEAKAAPVVETIPALTDVKRPAKPFFMEVKPGVERVIKRGDKTAASQAIDLQARRKGPTAEESPEELAERIERELQSQSFLRRAPMRRQMCTKCGINAVAPRFTIDRELGYCDSCAEILRLGETKEAKRMEFNLAAKKEEGVEAPGEAGPSEEGEEEPVPEDLDD